MLRMFTADTPHATTLCITVLMIWTFAGVLATKTITDSLRKSQKNKRSRKKC